ncbi:MAG: transcriptional regulator TrmB [Patescibacteria group bacterium]|nr:transcriptional regulator TrmB [Patescibacteria group bacterium]
MDDQKLISHIEELGLSNKEARVYVACLKLGPSPVQRIADQSGIKRVTTYVILESLVGLGLVSQNIKGKKTYFVAEEPSNLERLLEKREQELKEQKHSFDQILPQLLSLKTVPKEMPEVKFYDSVEGVRSLFANLFESYKGPSRDIYAFSNLDQVNAFNPERGMGNPNPDRVKHGVKSRILYTTIRGSILRDNDKEHDRESRFIPLDLYPMTGDISVFGDYVVMLSLDGNRSIGVTIRNGDLAHAMKVIFDMSWSLAEKFN